MGVGDVMQQLRNGGYGKNETETSSIDTPNGGRVLPLTAEELKTVPDAKEGDEICLSVYGTMTKEGLQVSRVEPDDTDAPANDGASEVMSRLDQGGSNA